MKIENCELKIANSTCTRRLRRNCHALADRISPIWNLQSAIWNFRFSSLPSALRPLLLALCTLLLALCPPAQAQAISDKMVATVTTGARATPDLITYSDITWQLALEPKRTFSERPSSPELNQGLKTLEDQLLILQEARKLPLAQTAEARNEFEKQVSNMRNELAQIFGSRARLEERMSRVGLTSEHLDAILRDRVTIERYLDFRFRAFVLVGAKEISDRYEQIYRPLRNSGKLVPTLEQARDTIEHTLVNEKIADEIGKFVDNLREQPGTEIVILNPV